MVAKGAIMGALSLYLDFINLFMCCSSCSATAAADDGEPDHHARPVRLTPAGLRFSGGPALARRLCHRGST